ncbi:MAG TPA: HupE/UreJ family protein [Nannocystis exedens]|nr:HupE/UreJ family protein [Nannocystis exedens]
MEPTEATRHGETGSVVVEIELRLPPQVSDFAARRIDLQLPAPCTISRVTGGRPQVRRWRGHCIGGVPESGQIVVDGLGRGLEVVVDLRRPGVPVTTALLRRGASTIELHTESRRGSTSGLGGYFTLGAQHIFTGLDHLLFVVGLVLLALRLGAEKGAQRAGWWVAFRRVAFRLFATLTAFTIAHSLSLAAATLGWLRVPGPPVEACIALSIVLLAREVVRSRHRLRMRSLWAFAFACGLLHGLGFAGALAELGLPSEALLGALLLFNVGVEAGQIAVASLTLVVVALLVSLASRLADRRVPGQDQDPASGWVRVGLGTVLGSLAAAWTIERTLAFFS